MKIVRFGLVGIANTLTDYSVYWSLVMLGSPPQVANVVSIFLAATFSFIANRHFTFADSKGLTPFLQQATRHAGVTASAIVLSAAIIHASPTQFGPLLAKALAIPAVFLWNYRLSLGWVWARSSR
ncbi:MAG: GtrA family protein [Rhizobiales bacterium]|nr:GtrA family protein [Hyphomicrobiales bacterium]MBI3673769.1 GtrA family protein [Hyphomicrobiales bacterium]